MGYSGNKAAVERVKPLLDQMLRSEHDLIWPSENAHMLCYHIREGMTVAQSLKIDPYTELKKEWVIRNKGSRVVAERKNPIALEALQAAMSKMELEDVRNVMEIVGAAILHKAHQMYFPDAVFTPEDSLSLYNWCQRNGYHLVVAEVGVTITKDDPGEAAWTP